MEKIKGFWNPDKMTMKSLNSGIKKIKEMNKRIDTELEEEMRIRRENREK